MVQLRNREHDFSSKLKQDSTLQRLRDYIQWQRNVGHKSVDQDLPLHGPISINLDLTSACNFSCPFCVDSRLINAGKNLPLEEIKNTIDILTSHGLLSIILIGGGEPTLHPHFGEVVNHIKDKGLQLGIVTNGSRLEKINAILNRLKEKDWIRISIDAAKEGTFKKLHHPKTSLALNQILEKAKKLREKNPLVSLGYSYVIVWEGVKINGEKLCSNIQEMSGAVELAREFSFDYISFKPCLIRFEESQRETLLEGIDEREESKIIDDIETQLQKAKGLAGSKLKILESSNLKAMLHRETNRIKRQPKKCHMQFFRTVVTPFGIYHCPAFRGVEIAEIAKRGGYATEERFKDSLASISRSIMVFDAEQECKDVGCFYNDTNWWLEKFIHSKENVHDIQKVEDGDFFL